MIMTMIPAEVGVAKKDLSFVLAALGPTRSSARSDVWTRPRT